MKGFIAITTGMFLAVFHNLYTGYLVFNIEANGVGIIAVGLISIGIYLENEKTMIKGLLST